MTVTLRALSALLTYPSPELQAAAPDIARALCDEGLLGAEAIAGLEPLLAQFAADDIFDVQERFVLLFDRSRSLSLNLFEHVHGESRDRGGAMVDLLETYRAGGFEPVGPELPDHLPMLLEFLSTRPLAEAREMLADAAHIFVAVAERLEKRKSPYAPVFRALETLAASPAEAELLAEISAQPDDDPEDLAALDAIWEEAAVTFGPDPNAGCPTGRDLLARMGPAPQPEWTGEKG
ncbi:nitrate reductase molybdenum cofactor assembly chaperone [Pikeienuella piscinae]|uniref:Nitrate reductase molybdenum cofactor assembly chaperone n=1 Tax=Pikeienuella piscinae TaxID=2748098 RepID=A0A7L5C135_9RHOB|nr:nitrate reductase molybdenum cofactor assembly chaperone [Pikeienuella piscinae]QIE56186.1 nitrate reductase molybdenum cofactor assembly chaperone [Pikeienuella piscinae]